MEVDAQFFKDLNEIALNSINIEHKYKVKFELIGFYFYKFLENETKEICFKIPYYSIDFKDSLIAYLRTFDFIYKIKSIEKLSKFENVYLFDVFEYHKNRKTDRKNDLYFVKSTKFKGQNVFFGNYKIASTKHFLPLFDLKNHNVNKSNIVLNEAFKLFSEISNKDLISYPILINEKKNISLYLTQKKILSADFLLSENIVANEIEDEIESIIENFSSYEIDNIFTLKFPYNSNIDSRVQQYLKCRKKIQIVLNSRLSYDSVEDNDFILIPNESQAYNPKELFERISDFYTVINTEHKQALYDDLKSLKEEWRTHNFNIYSTPYPAKWFLCIHQGENKTYWKSLYRKEFPEVPEILYRKIEKIIESIYDLNWIDNFLQKNIDTSLFLPKSKIFQESIYSLRTYIEFKFPKIKFFKNEHEVFVSKKSMSTFLDPFNIIGTSNIIQSQINSKIQIVVPDFLFFNYQPYLKYHILKYLFDPLLLGLRKKIDINYNANLIIWEQGKSNLLKQIFNENFVYNKKYKTIESQIIDEESFAKIDQEIIEYNEAEILLIEEKLKAFNRDEEIKIYTTSDKEITLLSNQIIFRENRNFLIKTNANSLKIDDLFISSFELHELIKSDLIPDKLAKMPISAKKWQVDLYLKNRDTLNLYTILVQKGLEVSNERFNDNYLVSDSISIDSLPTNFPKKKQNWNIICRDLKISEIELNQAWISYYGRKDLNKVKSLYSQIFKMMVEERVFGNYENTSFLDKVVSLINQTNIFENNQVFDYLELAISIINSISSEIKLHKVKELKKIS